MCIFVSFLLSSATACDLLAIDLHGQRIGAGNIEEKLQHRLPMFEGQFGTLNINLSNNMLDDGAVQDLVNMFFSHGLTSHVSELDITNNHVSLVGLKTLFPLLKESNFKWLLLSINSLSVTDMQNFWEFLEEQAVRTSILERSRTVGELTKIWASKLVWLPREYDIERFPIAQVIRQAHVEYYKTH